MKEKLPKYNIFTDLIKKRALSVVDNRIKLLNKIDMSMYGSKAWAFTIQEIGNIKGKEYVLEIGKLMGMESAKEIKEEIDKKSVYLPEKFKKIENIIEIMGFGVADFSIRGSSAKIIIRHNKIIEYGNKMYGKESFVQDFYKGVYNGIFKVFYPNKNLEIIFD